jgi:gas vesicle protein
MKQKLRAVLGVTVASTALVAFAASGIARADEPVEQPQGSKQETVGVFGGAGIGALAGGPFGLILGMAFGGWIGDHMHTQKETARQLAQELEKSKRETQALNDKLEASDRAAEALSLQLEASREKLAQVNERS